MSDLDLSQPLTPPEEPAQGIALTPPAAVPEIDNDQAVGMVAIPADKQSELQQKAAQFVASLAEEEPGSPAFTKKIDDIVRMGEKEITSSSAVSNRMLERPSTSLAAIKGKGDAAAPQAKVAKSLQDLRSTITDLDPARAEMTGVRRVLGHLPGSKKITHYFQRYESSQKQLDAIVNALVSGQDGLRKDNASIELERQNLWTTMGKLSEYATLAAALDEATSKKADELRATDPKAADSLLADALFPIRQRRQDLTTQIAVSVQGYLALDMIRKNNLELIKGVERARTTTVAALRTAVVVAQALANQRLVLDQIGALNEATNTMIGRTSELLKQQTGMIHEQATNSGVSVETLQHAFDNVFATMNDIDSYRAKAVEGMQSTVTALEGQIERSRSYLERSRSEQVRDGQLGSGTTTTPGAIES
ncbi:toxic anion resistance protein [Frondihabitans sp. PAMC 28766]|uniref:toxic anion resistance protein n=1 Tax=Frondihabitans sp. PAMC 28766 TaxID=1795630 RepID=UPI00078C59D7|nr:toxic anion resistance protein [Frondihabitans sp. PAMC 28766]AMM22279.1 toxic anion resistance protein [Frondihabitans sp. PAMC 28766]